jgi:hypothetical protein
MVTKDIIPCTDDMRQSFLQHYKITTCSDVACYRDTTWRGLENPRLR